MTFNVLEAEDLARSGIGWGLTPLDQKMVCQSLLTLAALARGLAEGLVYGHDERPETPCKWCLTIAKARVAGLLPVREENPADDPKQCLHCLGAPTEHIARESAPVEPICLCIGDGHKSDCPFWCSLEPTEPGKL
jgi:hypothetical protein